MIGTYPMLLSDEEANAGEERSVTIRVEHIARIVANPKAEGCLVVMQDGETLVLDVSPKRLAKDWSKSLEP